MNKRKARTLLVVGLLAGLVGGVIYWRSSTPSPTPAVTPEESVLPPVIVVPATGPAREEAIGQIVRAGRVALKKVGMDADAQTMWLRAINEPAVPAKERQNLIEDLNEEGFPDPKQLTIDDLPLVVTRLELIERVLPQTTDQTNIAAFKEAQKDLLQMQTKLAAMDAGPRPK